MQFLTPKAKINIKIFLKYLILAALSSLLMQSDDYIQKLFTEANQATFELKFTLSLLGFHLLLWLAGNRTLALTVISLFAVMQFIQLLHISYLGRPLDPTTITSSLKETGDISSAVQGTLTEHLHIILAVVIPFLINFYLFWRFLPNRLNKWLTTFCYLGIFLILASKPYRATYRDLNFFLPSPTRPSLYNSLDTFSFLLVKGFPDIEDVMPKAEIPKPILSKIESNAHTVWLIIADSIRADHMQIFGYERETTPNLVKWQSKGLTAHKGIAAAVATAASIPLMMNVIQDPGNLLQLKSEETNLFKLAKEAGFKTTWLSSQGSRVLNDLGVRHIDTLIGQEDALIRFEQKRDQAIIEFIDEQNLQGKNFVVILLRGAHAPYKINYDPNRKEFAKWNDDDELDRIIEGKNSYDNSILFTDSVLDQILERIYSLEGENHVVITADHGQLLGEDNLWGHNILRKEVAIVPLLSASWNAPNGTKLADSVENTYWISHFEMSRWLAARLGTDIELQQYDTNRTFLQGKNLYGINQYLEVDMTDEIEINLSEPFITPNYVPYLIEKTQ
ncbi:sulfatase-like hydrolase/transferase [Thorsellia anophelis]|uniref:Phosphoethanolamine transferase for glucans (OPG), alkaline phosphatase superfamily n=1 Tax=Thorsellia anophelis DSM 18579 TaxID=1123402 RepID=A0A1I0BRQ2_9GAMM|nr:sulfatase-like hydrolase/transferase [Thorsellia anophelis]SET09723.1 Phosphoethanolamine transferase for glucans (OPG), alkaline phosphatase superfamily [Thorsellia anophelis DSM 18579]